jgi:hypothetical protein
LYYPKYSSLLQKDGRRPTKYYSHYSLWGKIKLPESYHVTVFVGSLSISVAGIARQLQLFCAVRCGGSWMFIISNFKRRKIPQQIMPYQQGCHTRLCRVGS